MKTEIVKYVVESGNVKIGKADATYASVNATCPKDCALKDSGCYATMGNVALHQRKLSISQPIEAARAEALAIDQSYGGEEVPQGRPLRLHVSGDSRTVKGTRLLANAIKRWQRRGGGRVWSYTHAWKRVARKEWKTVSVLASLDNIEQLPSARRMGYAPAIVVRKFDSPRAFNLEGYRFIPCPAQTRETVTCIKCRLCWKADFLFERKMGIAFEAHSVKKRTLPVVK